MLSSMGHTVSPHSPDATVEACVQEVKFSLDVEPHVLITNVQQTPNPSAHEPELVPLLSLHS